MKLNQIAVSYTYVPRTIALHVKTASLELQFSSYETLLRREAVHVGVHLLDVSISMRLVGRFFAYSRNVLMMKLPANLSSSNQIVDTQKI